MEAIGIIVLVLGVLAVVAYAWDSNKTSNKNIPKKGGGGGKQSPSNQTKLK